MSSPLENHSVVGREEKSVLIPPGKVNVSSMNMNETNKVRVKRQSSGAGKFTEAAKMPQVKLMRVLLQLFKNSWDSAYVGGSHLFHPSVPKVVIELYKQKIVEFFVPDVGEDITKT